MNSFLSKNNEKIKKDSKGRKLKDGEGQRKDKLYYYRYTDTSGKRCYVYDRNLDKLREKEREIQLQLAQGVSLANGKKTLGNMIDEHFALKKTKWRASTKETMEGYRYILQKSNLYTMPINKIKTSDCKAYLVNLQENYSYSVVCKVYMVMKDAFNLACENDALVKNPCSFKLRSIAENDSEKIPALTEIEENSLLDFLKNDSIGKKYIDIFVVLLGTGLRISELAALTVKDVDFVNNEININKQIIRIKGAIQITKPKTDAAIRKIPMIPEVRVVLKALVERQKQLKINTMVDGHIGFLFTSCHGNPRTESEYSGLFRRQLARYNAKCEIKIERCTPHSLRHTFATKCVASGMDIKKAQYLMGHEKANTLLDIYADVDKNNLADSIKKIKIG